MTALPFPTRDDIVVVAVSEYAWRVRCDNAECERVRDLPRRIKPMGEGEWQDMTPEPALCPPCGMIRDGDGVMVGTLWGAYRREHNVTDLTAEGTFTGNPEWKHPVAGGKVAARRAKPPARPVLIAHRTLADLDHLFGVT